MTTDKIIERIKCIARGERMPECRTDDMVFVIAVSKDPHVLQVKTDRTGTGIHVWLSREEAEEYRRQLEPLGTNEYCVLPIFLRMF